MRPCSLFDGMPNARTVIERSMKSKYLSEVRFSSVNGASYWPNCRMAIVPQGAMRDVVVRRVQVRLHGGHAGVGGGPDSEIGGQAEVDEVGDPAGELEARAANEEGVRWESA